MEANARERVPQAAVSGCPGACMEAQADGVPCAEIRDCEKCGRAQVPTDPYLRLATAH